MQLAPLISDLAVILAVAAVVTLLFQRIRQPVVLGYIAAGFICGPHVLKTPLVSETSGISTWADLGVIFLMFSLGLEFSFRRLARVGLSSAMTALFEVSLMNVLGFACGHFILKWPFMDCVFLGAMLSISSTTIIIKALDELRLKTRRFAEMVFGVLVVEDLIAVLILVALSTMATAGSVNGLALLNSAAKLAIVVVSWFLAGYFVLPRLLRYVGRLANDEMLTIVSLSLCLLLVVLAAKLHYSVALGAFIMGSILAESSESHRIEELIAPLRDLFAAVFFVSVGMLIDPGALAGRWGSVALVAGVLMVGKITTITLGALLTGSTLRTSVQVGFGMAQVGEFSFIIAGLGQALGLTSRFLYPIAVFVSITTAFTTPYLIRVSHKVAVWLEARLPLRIKHALTQYAAWMQERSADARRRADFFRRAGRLVLNGVIVTATFVVTAELLTPFIGLQLSATVPSGVAWLFAILACSPFLWAMFSSFKGFRLGSEPERGTGGGGVLVISRLVTVLWIGTVTLEFFDLRLVLILTGVIAAALLVAFHRQLSHSYHWFEDHFLSTFEGAAKTRKPTDIFRHLAPWDAHLVRFKVHPNSELVGKALAHADLRARFGLSVVVIQRGLRAIVAPQPQELIFPKDELLVLGTDEQQEAARREIEKPPGLSERFHHISGFELKKLLISEESTMKDAAIRDSGIRERFGGMVVGLERGDERTINPSANIVLRPGDVLWVVGEADKLQKLR